MHRSRAAYGLIAVTLVITLSESLAAKGRTVRLTISGPGLSGPIETMEPKALANVWVGSFIGGLAAEPDKTLPRYVVTFYVQPPRENVRAMYVVYYVRDPRSREGFVYLPGRGEDGYSLNVRTILRDGQDGRWHNASAEWSDAIVAALR
jgi:hypothetical protein